ncbi:MAG: EAL domain-containing protein [Gemmatimonadaceae bacterium]|nr:EAL domain-containing protein [Gemmatimonadaceae bacterium]
MAAKPGCFRRRQPSARRAASTQVQRKRFDILRTRLGLFIAGEELLYTERHHHEQRVRVLTTALILAEILLLLLVIGRPADTVARLGGDEFAVLLENETDGSRGVTDTIIDAFVRPFSVQGTDIVVTVSIGIASATLERLDALKALGVRLSIDDFGTGYSSLAYLERFPVDSLKMDRSFIAGLGRESSNSPLAEAVIGLGRILGLRVVAEGIETAEQWDVLRRLGCSLGQGFYLSRPLPPVDFERLLANPRLVSSRTPPAGTSEVRRRTRRMVS